MEKITSPSSIVPVPSHAFQELIEHGREVSMLTDADGIITYVSPASASVLGYKPEELIGRSRFDFLSEIDRATLKAAQESIRSTPGAEITVSVNWHKPDGTVRDIDCTLRNLLDDPTIGNITCQCHDVTDIKESHAEVARSRAMLKATIDSSTDAICSIDTEGRIVTYNATLQHIMKTVWGIDLREGIRIHDNTTEEERQFWIDLQALALRGDHVTAERHYVNPYDDALIEFNLYPIIEGDAVVGASIFGKNVTEQRRILQQVQFQADILAQTGDVVVATNADDKITYWNAAAERQFGIPASEVIGRPGRSIFPDWEGDFVRIEETLKRGEIWRGLFRSKGGRASQVSIHPLREGYTDAGRLWIAHEITEQERIEKALEKSESDYRMLFENSPLPMWIVDTETFRFLLVNRAAADLYGYTEEEMLSRTIVDIRPPEQRRGFQEGVAPALRKPEEQRKIVVRHEKKNGERLDVQIFSHHIIFEGRACRLALIEDITERLKVEHDLQEANERFRLATETVSSVIYELDIKAQTSKRSRGLRSLLGFDPSEVEGVLDWWLGRIHPDDLPRASKLIDDAIKGSGRYEAEYRMQHRDGHYVHVWDRGIIARNEAAEATHIIGSAQDITERVVAQQELKQANERFQLASEAVSSMIYEIDFETGTAIRSNGMFQLLGFDPNVDSETASFDWWVTRVHPEDVRKANEALAVGIERGEHLCVAEYRVRHKNGHYITVLDRGVIQRDPAGKPVRLIGSTEDITERVEYKQKLELANQRFNLAADAVSAVIYEWDIERDYCQYSSGLRALLGFDPQTETNIHSDDWWMARVHPEDAPMVRAIVRDAPRLKMTYEAEYRMLHKNGHYVYVWDRGVIQRDHTGKIIRVIGSTQDISARKQMEAQLEQQRNAAITAKEKAEEMMRLKTSFLANMSHEIRTPMTAILGFAEMLAEGVQDKRLASHAAMIESSAKRLLGTINSILDLAQVESKTLKLDPSVVDVNLEVSRLVSLLEPIAIKSGIQLQFTGSREPIHAYIDRQQFAHVVNNLVGNAIKFTDEGAVNVYLHLGSQPEERFELMPGFAAYNLGKRPQGDQFSLVVADTGIGIEPESLPMIFQEFMQESTGYHRTHQGTGLGLTIASRIVEAMGGSVEARSARYVGSTFIVRLPLDLDKASRPLVAQAAEKKEPGKATSGTIVIVEDSIETAELLCAHLESQYEVIHAPNISQARAIFKEMIPKLIFMDINLGEFTTGLDLTRILREDKRFRDVPIVALTAYAMKADREAAFDAGCTDFLGKPFTRKQLFAVVERAMVTSAP